MEVRATTKNVRISAQKCRLVINQVRNQPVDKAIELLKFSPKKAAQKIRKTLESALANAENNHGADIDELWISAAMVDNARVLKRWRARAKGRATPIIKRSSHITIELSDETRTGKRQ